MKLGAFYDRIGPYLHGRRSHQEAVEALYPPEEREGQDARRLAIYGRMCRLHRFTVVESVYTACHQAVVQRAGVAAWEAMVEDYFKAHPMHHWEMNHNGAALPEFLLTYGPLLDGLPWLAELADFDWWEWLVQVTLEDPDEAGDPGPLRLSPVVELRRYQHDLIGWLDEDLHGPAGGPLVQESYVLFWRDRQLHGQRERAAPIEMLVLKAVSEGSSLVELGEQMGEDVGDTVEDLHQAGILIGALEAALE